MRNRAGAISIHNSSADSSKSGNPSGGELLLNCSSVFHSRESMLGLRKQQQLGRGKTLALTLIINHLSYVTKEISAILVKLLLS